MVISDEVIKYIKEGSLKAFNNNEIPVSCVIIDSEGNVISTGINSRQSNNNILGHAEINAIVKAEENIKDWRLDGYTMIVSLEPCEMCSSIIKESRIDKVYYFLSKKTKDIIYDYGSNKVKINKYTEVEEYLLNLLTTFFDNKR